MIVSDSTPPNTTKLKHTYCIDDCDNSNIEVKVLPSVEGQFWVHVFIGSYELIDSPKQVTVTKSQKHLELD